ncbi:MAG: hypothetical protein KJ941_03365 [Bacteroidetes bacterium]|nr:hypothetical protein [Bacteroidota bacterium]
MMDNEFIEKGDAPETVVQPKKKAKKNGSKGNFLISLVNGEFLTKEFVLNNLSFIFYMIFMLLLLVAKGYYGKQLTKNVDTSQKELNEILGDFVAKKALLEEKTRRIQLVEELAPHGLKETVNPTKVIRLSKDNE